MSAAVSRGLHRVLLLGAGYTAAPLVEWLTKEGTTAITIASRTLEKALKLSAQFENTNAIQLNVKSEEDLTSIIPGHSLIINFLPFRYNPLVAKQCIASKTSMLSTSYVTPTLKELDGSAKKAGVSLFYEIGLNPGIDHMLAMECIEEVHDKGGKIVSYEVLAGGLPTPENANNPLKYKFSWSPRDVMESCLLPATFLRDGKLIQIPSGGEIMSWTQDVDILPGNLESIANRDSSSYKEMYNIPEVQSIFRGRLRYKGFCSIIREMLRVGLLADVELECLQPDAPPLQWKEFMKILLSKKDTTPSADVDLMLLDALNDDKKILTAFQELGLLSNAPVPLKLTPLESLSVFLDNEKLQYKPGESDAICMRQAFSIKWPNNSKECRLIDMVEYGTPGGHSAMAKYTSLPAAIVASLMLDGSLKEKGIVCPTIPSVYKPVLKTLRDEGLNVKISSEMIESK